MSSMISVGFENYVNKDRIISVVDSNSSPSKRLIEGAREQNLLVDATMGKRTNTLVVMDSGHVIMSHNMKETLAGRFNKG